MPDPKRYLTLPEAKRVLGIPDFPEQGHEATNPGPIPKHAEAQSEVGVDAGQQDDRCCSNAPDPGRIPEAVEAIYKACLKDLEADVQESVVLEIISDLSIEERYNILLLLGQQTRFFFRVYQSETLSPMPNPVNIAAYGVASAVTSAAAEYIQRTIPGCTEELAEASDHQAKAFIFRSKQIILGKIRGQLILPPGVEGGPEKTK